VPNPGDPQSLNRYSYVLNNPLRYTDPTGHNPACAAGMGGGPLGVMAALACEVWFAVASVGPQVQALAVELQQLAPLAAELPAAMDPNVDPPAAPSNAGNTVGPGGLDPNDWGSKQEQIVRQSLANDYQQVYGASDAEIRQGLGIQGKVADFVGYNSQQGRWLIAESKGSDMYKAVEQLQNTMQGVLNKGGAATANVDLRIFTNEQSYQRLLTTTPVQGGWTVQNGVLGWWGEANQFVPMIINGVQVLVNVVN
jgi:hypothetical protein